MNFQTGGTPLALPTCPQLEQLEGRVRARLNGRVHDFCLLARGHGLILRGRAPTYYVKQLAQEAVLATTGLPVLANDIQVR